MGRAWYPPRLARIYASDIAVAEAAELRDEMADPAFRAGFEDAERERRRQGGLAAPLDLAIWAKEVAHA